MQAALELPREERAAFVAEACEGNAALQAEVESLLAAPDTGAGTGGFLAAPPLAGLAAMGDDPDGEVAGLAAALADRYVVERRLGRGGMATVYLARDLRHGRPVAIKVLHPQLSVALGPERFLREIALTASLQHPHVLPLFDSGSAAGRLYYVMPYVEGETLRARLARGGPLPSTRRCASRARSPTRSPTPTRAASCTATSSRERAAAGGRAAARARRRLRGRARRGARRRGAPHAHGLAVGTPQYMAPEQAAGRARRGRARRRVRVRRGALRDARRRAAVRRAVGAAGGHARAHRGGAAARRAPPDVPPHVAAAVATALAKRPDARFRDAAAFVDALAAAPAVSLPAAPTAAPSPPRALPPRATPRRRGDGPFPPRSSARWRSPSAARWAGAPPACAARTRRSPRRPAARPRVAAPGATSSSPSPAR
jgi:serine/threonine-protein kinase